MAMELPRFDDTYCQFLSLCARISEETAAKLPQEDLDLTSSYAAVPGKALARIIWTRGESCHFHLDIALRSTFGKKPPAPNTRVTDFRKALREFTGAVGVAIVHGYFAVPLTSLPPSGGLIFTGSSAIKLKVSKTEIELTGASLTFRNADIDQLRWDLVKDQVLLDVFARRTLTVNDAYLRDAFQKVDAAVARYVIGKKTDGKTSSA